MDGGAHCCVPNPRSPSNDPDGPLAVPRSARRLRSTPARTRASSSRTAAASAGETAARSMASSSDLTSAPRAAGACRECGSSERWTRRSGPTRRMSSKPRSSRPVSTRSTAALVWETTRTRDPRPGGGGGGAAGGATAPQGVGDGSREESAALVASSLPAVTSASSSQGPGPLGDPGGVRSAGSLSPYTGSGAGGGRARWPVLPAKRAVRATSNEL